MGDKSEDAFRTISEVAEDMEMPQHVLRFWETRFAQIKPMKRGGGRRYYRPQDVLLLKGIRFLLYDEGYTIKGVQRILKEQGVQHVIQLGLSSVTPPELPIDLQDASLSSAVVAHLNPVDPASRPVVEPSVSQDPQREPTATLPVSGSGMPVQPPQSVTHRVQAEGTGPAQAVQAQPPVQWLQDMEAELVAGPAVKVSENLPKPVELEKSEPVLSIPLLQKGQGDTAAYRIATTEAKPVDPVLPQKTGMVAPAISAEIPAPPPAAGKSISNNRYVEAPSSEMVTPGHGIKPAIADPIADNMVQADDTRNTIKQRETVAERQVVELANSVRQPGPGETSLSVEDVRLLQSILFELLECKRELDRVRDQ